MTRIGVLGYSGRMGSLIAQEIVAHQNCQFAGGVVRAMAAPSKDPEIFITTDAREVMTRSDVVIDFTTAETTAGYARMAAELGKPFVSGTTGLSDETRAVLQQVSTQIPVLYAANTSLSLAAMKHVVSLCAKLLANFDYDVSILDEHHRMKKDAPSGTAKALGDAVLVGNHGVKKPEYAAIRSGHIVGEHEVLFAGAGEVIRLRHSITDRRVFARGAVEAARWLAAGKPAGFYSMDDVLGIVTAI